MWLWIVAWVVEVVELEDGTLNIGYVEMAIWIGLLLRIKGDMSRTGVIKVTYHNVNGSGANG